MKEEIPYQSRGCNKYKQCYRSKDLNNSPCVVRIPTYEAKYDHEQIY